MAPCSELSLDDIVGVWPLTMNAQETSPRLVPERGIDSSVIREWGALFSESEDSRPAQLDPRDVEDTVDSDQAQAEAEAGQAAAHRTPSTGPMRMPARGTASARPQLSPVMEYLSNHPYLLLSDLEELRRQRSARTVRAHGAQSSSSQDTRNSECLSAEGCSLSSSTESTHEGEEEGSTHSPFEREPTPYFTPSHTPSHRSVGTATEDVNNEGRAPNSPHPRSNFYPYDAKYGLTAVEHVDQ